MSRAQGHLFAGARLTLDDAMRLTITSLREYGARFDRWAIAWSGGKDSTALVTFVVHLIETGQIARPKELTVFYADTRMELLPLSVGAMAVAERLRAASIDVRTVMAPLDKRFLVYMLGRGVPPPNNNTFRWCTRQIKVDPMHAALRELVAKNEARALMLTGVRQGESAIRDSRIAMSCGRDGAECGQGWYQEMDGDLVATLAPLLHWRVCNVWDWLKLFAPSPSYGGWPTTGLADAYGGDEAEEINARTGCVGCPLANHDTALDAVLRQPSWAYLAPLKGLRPIFRALRLPENRLRKPGGERRKSGELVKNQHRMGPTTLEARSEALRAILHIQGEINTAADRYGRPHVDVLNNEEVARIRELIAMRTWPRKWTGDEPTAHEPFEEEGVTRSMFGA